MASTYLHRFIENCTGVNNTLPDEAIADTDLADAANFMPDPAGSGTLIKRSGITKESSVVGAEVTSIFDGKNGDYFSIPTAIYSFAGSSLVTGLTSCDDPSWCAFNAYDVFVNGAEKKYTANGTDFSNFSTMPAGVKYVESMNNFLFAAGHSAGTLAWSDLEILDSFSSGNYIRLTKDEADDIKGMKKFQAGMIVFCQKSFHHINGYTSRTLEVTYSSYQEGCTSHRSIVVTDQGIFWWSKAGLVRSVDGSTLDYPMTRKLGATLANLNKGKYSLIHGMWYPIEKKVRYFVFNGTSQATVNMAIDYYYERDSFYLHTGAGAQMAASGMAIVSGAAKNYCGGYGAANYLYEQTGTNDDGTAIDGYIETKRMAHGSNAMVKVARSSTVTSKVTTTASIYYGYYIDGAASMTNSTGITASTGITDNYVGVNRMHRKIKHRIGDASSTRPAIVGLTHKGEMVRPL